jgi:secreted trypsin-like serine protease
MTKQSALLAFIGSWLVVVSSSLAGDFKSKIINGYDCDEQKFPDAVLILSGSGNAFSRRCSGTLIAPDVVLTAAHCVSDISVYYFVTQQADLSSGFIQNNHGHYASHIAAHHKYKTSLIERADIGLIYLRSPLRGKPAQIATEKQLRFLTAGNALFLAGWGKRQTGAQQTQEAGPKKQCAVSIIDEITPEKIQVGKSGVTPRKCFGDSGGGSYVFDYKAQEYVLVGLSSHGSIGDDGCYTGSYDTRVDYYINWVKAQLELACKLGIRKAEYCGV